MFGCSVLDWLRSVIGKEVLQKITQLLHNTLEPKEKTDFFSGVVVPIELAGI